MQFDQYYVTCEDGETVGCGQTREAAEEEALSNIQMDIDDGATAPCFVGVYKLVTTYEVARGGISFKEVE